MGGNCYQGKLTPLLFPPEIGGNLMRRLKVGGATYLLEIMRSRT